MKKLLLACLLLQGLYLQKVDAATIRSGSFRPAMGFGAWEYPGILNIAGDGFSVVVPLVWSSGYWPNDGCCYAYGSTTELNFSVGGGLRYWAGGTNGFLFNDNAYTGFYLWGWNRTFGGGTPEDSLYQSPERWSGVRITATPIVFPNPGGDVPKGQGPVLTGTFELTGSLCGYLTGTGAAGPQPCVFDMPTVYGRGTYELKTDFGTYQGPNQPGYWNVDTRSFIFKFTDPAADVPEPGTMAMLALGVAGLGLSRCAKHNAKQPAKRKAK